MTRLRILHDTVYRYRKPVRFGSHRLILRPREGHDIDVAAMWLEIEPAHELYWTRDIFGNSIGHLIPTAPSDVLRIRSQVLLDRRAAGDPVPAPAGDYPVAYSTLEQAVASAYLAPSFPDDASAVRHFVSDVLGLPARGDAFVALTRLNAEIHQRFTYRRREEKGVQSPAETLSLGSASCRDKAVLLMECARTLGIAARFVSGYLDCPASEAGRGATHAWAETYLADTGWSGFDATIGETTSMKHVVVAVSNHPRGVMPISGTFVGDSGDYLGLHVGVRIERSDDGAPSNESPRTQ